MITRKKVIGVDTSLRSSGIGVVEWNGRGLTPVEHITVKNAAKLPHSECLRRLQEGINGVLERTRPDAAAIEGGFFFKNARTAMTLGEARGVVIACCAAAGIAIYEYTPRRVKQALVGAGTAHKEQVARMVMTILGIETQPPEDEADALAIAICHFNTQTSHAALQSNAI